MLSTFEEMDYSRLRTVIRRVRRRWRLRVLLKGTALVAVIGFAVLAALSYGLDYLRYRPWALTTFSVLIYGVLLILLVRYFVLPLSRRVADDRVALYIEEHEPELQAEILSAVEFSRQPHLEDTPERSAAFTRELIASAVMHCQDLQYGRAVERGSLRRFATGLAAVVALLLVAAFFSPAFMRAGAGLLLMPWTSTAFASPYAIDVSPGNVQVARGADQLVSAILVGFDSDRVEIAFRAEGSDWERWPMNNEENVEEFMFMLFDLDERTEYFIEASGVRSSMYRVDVTDLPYVERLELEYRFPAYSGLEPQTIEDGGDIAVLRGTEVSLRAYATVEVPGGQLVFDYEEEPAGSTQSADGDAAGNIQPLVAGSDGSHQTSFVVEREGTYRVELLGFAGTMTSASPVYFIEVLEDQPPLITFDTPGRDVTASAIDEVFVEISAEDDYGLGQIELLYSVNGGPQQALSLYASVSDDGATPVDDLTAGHTFYLEEEDLEPGDFISYFARAYDRGAAGAQVATTDIYFIEARPFDREFRQGQEGGMPRGGQQGQQQDRGAFAERQKEIVLATFKLIRDRDRMTADEVESDLATVAMLQDRVRQQVELVLGRTAQRGALDPGSEFQQMAENLRAAIEAMGPAHESLVAKDPDAALPHEQRALQYLQRAEALMREVQVSFSGGGQGGGGQQESVNEELADLLDLEMEKLRNQYETVQRGQQQQLDNQVDEALQRLQELARRQQQENERSRRLANLPQNMSGGGGASQRQLADQAEELARQLERLSRQNSDPELAETAQRLREAADAMRRSAASSDESAVSEGVAALRDIEQARDLLDQNRTRRLQRDMQNALDKIDQMQQEQEKIAGDVEQMGNARSAAERDSLLERMDRVLERKDELAGQTAALEGQIERMARDSRREQKEASRQLQETAAWMRDSKLADKIRYSKGVAQQRLGGYAEQFEEQIGNDLDQLEEMLEQASAAIAESGQDRLASSLDQTRDVVRRLESLQERMRRDQEGQEGQSGQQGQERQEGEQGQAGQQGQEAQVGQQGQQANRGDRRGGPSGPRGITPGNMRQYEGEYRQRLAEVEDLRDRLAESGQQVTDLDSIIESMRDLELEGTPRGIEELRQQVIEELKMFEYYLRRVADAESGRRPTLADSDEVPESYREMVEEYFRSLARGGQQQ